MNALRRNRDSALGRWPILSTRSIEVSNFAPHGQFTTLCSGVGIQVRFALKAERQMSLRAMITPFWRRARNLIGRQQCHCWCVGRKQRTRPGIV
jgi:hypothetical protein